MPTALVLHLTIVEQDNGSIIGFERASSCSDAVTLKLFGQHHDIFPLTVAKGHDITVS
jgi:hypothetical protein